MEGFSESWSTQITVRTVQWKNRQYDSILAVRPWACASITF